MKILQIGGGSMGSRRIRDLCPRSDVQIALLDMRADRRQKAHDNFGIAIFGNLEEALGFDPDVLSISTPPHEHDQYIELSLEKGLHHFCEASIWTYDYRKIETAEATGLTCLPSASMQFLPIIARVKEIIASGRLGSVQAWQMFLSVNEPGWHPDEGAEYYARQKQTCAGREMIPFELGYLNWFFGTSTEVVAGLNKRGTAHPDCADTWCLQLEYRGGFSGQLIVLMGSARTYRTGSIVGDRGALNFNVITGTIETHFPGEQPERMALGALDEEIEKGYFREINGFIDALSRGGSWPVSYRSAAVATAALGAAERSLETQRYEKIDPAVQPDLNW